MMYLGYEITPEGEVYSKNKRDLRKLRVGSDGQLYFTAYADGRTKAVSVARAVGECFVPNPNNFSFIIHVNGDRKDNRAANLEWVNESLRLAGYKRACACRKSTADGNVVAMYDSLSAAADDNGLSVAALSNYVHHKSRDPRGFLWELTT